MKNTLWLLALAGICMFLFVSVPGFTAEDERVSPADAKLHEGEFAMVCGLVAGARYVRSSRGKPTYLNFEKPYPESPFTAVVWGKDRKGFKTPPETTKGKQACVFGVVRLFKGRAEMTLIRPEQLSWKEPVGNTSDQE